MWARGGSAETEALIALVRVDITEAERARIVSGADIDRVVDLAIEHSVPTLVATALSAMAVTPSERSRRNLERIAMTHTVLGLHATHTIRLLGELLPVPFVIVKGPVIAESWYDDPLDRIYGDIDMLVAPHHFVTALERLEAAGFETPLVNWHTWLDEQIAEVPVRLDSTTLDLHWSLIGVGAVRSGLRLDEGAMFDRRVSAQIGTGQRVVVDTLDPTDTLLHLCVNAAVGGGRVLRSLVDIDRGLRAATADPDALVERSRDSGVDRLVLAIIDRCRHRLGTPLAPAINSALDASRLWTSSIRALDVAGGTARGRLPRGLLLGSGRATVPATLRATIDSVRCSITDRIAPATSPGGRLDWNRPPPDGDVATARERYLDWVGEIGAERDDGARDVV